MAEQESNVPVKTPWGQMLSNVNLYPADSVDQLVAGLTTTINEQKEELSQLKQEVNSLKEVFRAFHSMTDIPDNYTANGIKEVVNTILLNLRNVAERQENPTQTPDAPAEEA